MDCTMRQTTAKPCINRRTAQRKESGPGRAGWFKAFKTALQPRKRSTWIGHGESIYCS